MRNFVISDIHGHNIPMQMLFDHVGLDLTKDKLRFLGDYIDRGPQSAHVIRSIRALQEQGAEVQMGNHEQMHIMWVAGRLSDEDYFNNGGLTTARSFEAEFDQDEYEDVLQWMGTLPYISKDDEYIYVHAGINPYSGEEPDVGTALWIRTQFLTATPGLVLNASGGRKVVHGHTPRGRVKDDGARINIDLGAGSGNALALVELTEGIVYQINMVTREIRERTFDTETNRRVPTLYGK
jgi:serine/threonine protein phosphatase 1